VPKYSPFQSNVSILLYYLGIFLFLLYVRHLIRSISDPRLKNISILMAVIILALLNAVLLKLKVPVHMSEMSIFSPLLYAASNFLPSLSGLLTTSLFIFFLVFIFYSEFSLGDKKRAKIFQVLEMLFFIGLVFYFQVIVLLFRSLVVHSSISFETYRVLDISLFTFIGLFILALHFAAFTMLLDRFFRHFKPETTGRKTWIYVVVFAVLTWVAGFIQVGGPDLALVLLISLITGIVAVIRGAKQFQFNYSSFVLLIFVYSVVSVYQIRKYSEEKRHSEKMVLAVDLSAEHDPVAELLLKNLEIDISSDQELAYLIHEGYTDHLEIEDYLIGNYFSGFWEKYDMHFTLCSPVDSLYIEPYVDVWYP